MSQAEVNIGMVGHVDHGKTSLTKQLTGKWTDTHSEEIKRGISIRLGYADVVFKKCTKCPESESYTIKEKCPNCNALAKPSRKASFVDAPGHETLMTTMLSGAALMNGAVLVIAANEKCPQPRTEEHLNALELSGIKHIVVAQNKVDLVSREKAIENYKEIKKFLKENGFEEVPIIPTAANFGANIDLLIEAIEKNIPSPKIDLKKPLKMFVARSFDINKPGTKVKEFRGGALGGTIVYGKLKKGEEIEISPGMKEKLKTKAVSLTAGNNDLEEAVPGGLIGVGTLLDPSITRNDQLRGQVIGVVGSLPEPVQEIKAELFEFKRKSEKTESLKNKDLVVLSIGTATILGSIENLKGKEALFVLRSKVVVEKGQKIAVSKKTGTAWRLVSYGVAK